LNTRPYFLMQSVERALKIIDVMARQRSPVTLTDVAQLTGLHKSVAHRIIHTMESCGFVEKEEFGERYRAGMAAFEFGVRYRHTTSLVRQGEATLRELIDDRDQSASLAVRRDTEMVCLLEVNHQAMHFDQAYHGRGYLHNTALGKALLAWLPKSELAELIPRLHLRATTSRTIVRPGQLSIHLEEVRRLGYAVDDEESRYGWRCVSVPVVDSSGRVLVAVSRTAPTTQVSPEQFPAIADQLHLAASRISAGMVVESNADSAQA